VATERDLAEAHSFVRRRLVTALVSGAPGGREVERAARPGRAVLAGIALAVLLVGVAAVSGVLAGHAETDGKHTGPSARHSRRQPDLEPSPRSGARLAEDRGFEPLRACTQPAFQASAIGH
jgi:hypothetical protein